MIKLGVLAASSFELCVRVRENSDSLSTEVPLCAHRHTLCRNRFSASLCKIGFRVLDVIHM